MLAFNFVSNVIPDIPRIYTALAEWSACMVFIALLRNRFAMKKTIAVAIVWGIVQSTFLVVTGNTSLLLWIPCMVSAFAMMTIGIHGLCKVYWKDAVYCAMQAFVMAEFEASFFWQLFYHARETLGAPGWVRFPLFIAIYGITELWIYRLVKGHLPKDGIIELTKKDLISAAIITIAVFATSNISFVSPRTPFSAESDFYIKNIRTLVDLGGMAILYAHLIQCAETKMRRELDAVEGVLQTQYQQYKYSRESINLINIKYHDLKHQIAVLRAEEDPQKRAAFLDEMEAEIRRYDLQNKTGNAVLDTILTSKGLYCEQHGVTMTTVADGTLLSKMSTMDIASVFGNALDNALEACLKVEDKEKRLIHLSVARQKNFCLIQVENYFESKLNENEGKLISTKEDQPNHGYGIESIRYSMEKYDGVVNYSVKGNWFLLKILMPLDES